MVSENWQQLAKFYTEVLECSPVPPERHFSGTWLDEGIGLKDASLQGMHLRLPGFGENGPTLEIYQYKDMQDNLPCTAHRKGLGHLAFHVDDIREMMDKVLSNGGKSLGTLATHKIPDVGLLTFVYMTDPEGNILELQNWRN